MPAMNPVAGFTGLLLLGLGLSAATTESKSKLGAPELGPEGAGKPELGKSKSSLSPAPRGSLACGRPRRRLCWALFARMFAQSSGRLPVSRPSARRSRSCLRRKAGTSMARRVGRCARPLWLPSPRAAYPRAAREEARVPNLRTDASGKTCTAHGTAVQHSVHGRTLSSSVACLFTFITQYTADSSTDRR